MVELDGVIWFKSGSQQLGGRDRVELLRAIDAQGSITAAAKAVGISYKYAWDSIDEMNNLAGEPLVMRTTGGKGGGGTRLTDRGRRLIATFEVIERQHKTFMRHLERTDAEALDDVDLIKRFMLKTSARNKLFGTVAAVRRGAVNDEVDIQAQGGQLIVATITHESTLALELAQGSDVIALIKASSVMVGTGADALKLSARNQLAGRIARIVPGAVNAEVAMDLDQGGSIVAIISMPSVQAMGLAEGTPSVAIFDASSVIVGTIG